MFLSAGMMNLHAQLSADDSTILFSIVKQYTHSSRIVLVDTVNGGGFAPEDLKKAIRNRRLPDAVEGGKGHTLRLTRSERTYLLSLISKPTIWGVPLFSNSTFIPQNQVTRFLAEQRKSLIHHGKDTIPINSDTTGIHYVFAFCRPIYFRNHSLCLHSYSAVCNSNCGVTETIIFRKEHDEWKKLITVSSGVF